MKKPVPPSSLLFLAFGLAASVPAYAQDSSSSASSPFTASLVVGGYYTDNVYFSRPLFDQPRRGDWVTVIRPAIGYGYVFDKGRIDLGATADIGRYATYSSEDYADFNTYANGRYQFDAATIGVWGVNFGRDHEPRSSIDPQDQIGPTPTEYWKTSAYGAISHRFGDNTLKLGATYEGYDFLDEPGINNDDRDRDMGTLGARLTHKLASGQSVFAETTLDLRRYRDPIDDNGYMRDSQGVRAIGGWQANIGEHGRAELYGGLIYQDFRDPRFANIVAPDFGGRYTWSADGTSITADLRRTLDETTLAGTSSYITTRGSLQLSQDLANHIRLYGGASLADLDFQDSSRRDQLTNFWLGARKYLSPHVYVGAEAGFEERESTDPVNDYTETRIMARVGIDTARAFDPSKTGPITGPSGFYVGAGGEISHLGTMLDGPRQESNGSLTADFGAFGPGGRIIGGWGTDIGSTYLGVEGDYAISGAHWDHSRLPGGRVFSVEEKNSAGLSFIGGRRLAGGALVYGRAGIRSTEFDTDYATKNASADYSERLTGFEYGLGVSTPITPSLALSMEYAQTRYPDYLANAGNSTADRFANVEDSVRFALNYHFGGIPGAAAQTPDASAYSGAYWGLQAGLGAISSFTQGDREAGSVLNADFGDHGFTGGGVAGYDWTAGRFVFGGAVDAAVARETWNHDRSPDGRTYSLGKDGEVGVSGRLGYVLYGGSLLYGRLGAVASHFNNRFETNGVTLAASDWHTALRLGGGIEVPVSRSSRLRFDYSYTDYGTLSLSTPAGLETYDTKESLFRVGFLKSF